MAIIRGLDNPSDFQALFDQVDVDPFNPVQPFKDMDLDSSHLGLKTVLCIYVCMYVCMYVCISIAVG